MSNKNVWIGGLIFLLLISAIWGQKKAGDSRALQAQIDVQNKAVVERDALQEELTRKEAAERQTTAQIESLQNEANGLRQEHESLKAKIADFDAQAAVLKSEKEQEIAKAEEAKKAFAAEAAQKMAEEQAKLNALQSQLQNLQNQLAEQRKIVDEKQKIIAEDKQKLDSAALIIEQGQKKTKELEEFKVKLEAASAELKKAQATIQQQQTTQREAVAAAETLRAQVIGLEKIVEERSAALDATAKELERCTINKNVLISKVADQNNALRGMEKQQSTLVQEFAAKSAKTAASGTADKQPVQK